MSKPVTPKKPPARKPARGAKPPAPQAKRPAATKKAVTRKPVPRKQAGTGGRKRAPAGTMGRPTAYTDHIATVICQRLADGESLRAICASTADLPHRNTVMVWLSDPARADFQGQYARARELQADLYAAEVVEIADRVLVAVKRKVKGISNLKTVEETTTDAVDRSRLMVDARKWYASKLAPKKYGDKLAIGQAEDLAPLTVHIKNYGGLTPGPVQPVGAAQG